MTENMRENMFTSLTIFQKWSFSNISKCAFCMYPATHGAQNENPVSAPVCKPCSILYASCVFLSHGQITLLFPCCLTSKSIFSLISQPVYSCSSWTTPPTHVTALASIWKMKTKKKKIKKKIKVISRMSHKRKCAIIHSDLTLFSFVLF